MPRLKVKKDPVIEDEKNNKLETDIRSSVNVKTSSKITEDKKENIACDACLSKDGNAFWVKVCNFFITSSLVLIFFGIPLVFSQMTLQGLGFDKQMYFYIILLIGLFAWILKAIIEGGILIKRTPLDIPILVFLLATLSASLSSVNKWASFMGGWGIPAKSFVSILALALFYWFMISNITRKRLRIVLTSLVASIGLVCLLFILNIFSLNIIGWIIGIFGISRPAWTEAITKTTGFNTIGLLSNLEIFISASILIIVGIIGVNAKQRECESELTRKKWKLVIKNIILYTILIACLFIILTLGSYISLLGLLAGLGVILVLAMSRLVEMDKKIFSVNSFLFALIMVYILIGKTPVTIKSLPSEVGLSRSISWQISKEAFKDKYFLGAGLGNFEYVFNKYKPKNFNNNALWNTRFSEATGIFYESLATIGSIGTVALILLILTFLGMCLYIVVNRNSLPLSQRGIKGDFSEDGRGNSGLAYEASSALGKIPPVCAGRPNPPLQRGGQTISVDILFVALFAASISLGIDMALYLTGGVLIIFACLIATLVMALISINSPYYFKDIKLSYKVKPEYALALSFVFVCLSCAMLLVFISLGKIYLADAYARSAMQSENEEMAIVKINRAIKLFPYQYMYYEKLGDLLALVGDKEMQNGNQDMGKVQSLLVNALNSHKKAIALSPENAFSWENLGVLSEAIVKYDPTLLNDAENSYKKAIELDPNNPALRMRAGVIKEAKADIATSSIKQENNKTTKQGEDAGTAQNTETAKKFYNEAIECFNKAIELKSNLTSAYDGVSRIKEKLGQVNDAIDYMTVSYKLNTNNAFYSFNLGRLYYNRAVLGNRGLDADSNAEITRNEEEPSSAKAMAGEEEGVEGGEESLKLKVESLKKDQISNDKLENWGEEEGDEVESEKVKKEIREENKENSNDNDLKIAEALFKQAVQIKGDYVDALYSLGMVYEQSGLKNEAKEYYQKTIDALPENAIDSRKALEDKVR